ncbi:BQ5605_C005g03196 [Microbotryum silenes-dioicae]|uniref:BQ5605_C005g03196 protein n=1 Tax=Microbotryum silenes-dioicae TaxID=796604 RepID=A0A2X0N418_9BASI|nr:BQ5605_C005g03196 [Microbotryum silenes-dioicae]
MMELVPNTPSSQTPSQQAAPTPTPSPVRAQQQTHEAEKPEHSRIDHGGAQDESFLGVVEDSMARSFGESYLRDLLPPTQVVEERSNHNVGIGGGVDGASGTKQRIASRGEQAAVLVQGTSSVEIAQGSSPERSGESGGIASSPRYGCEGGDLNESFRTMPGMDAFHRRGDGNQTREKRDEGVEDGWYLTGDLTGDLTGELMGEMTMEMTRVGGGIQQPQNGIDRSGVDVDDLSAAQNSALLDRLAGGDDNESNQIKEGRGGEEQVSPSQKENVVPSINIGHRPSPSPTPSASASASRPPPPVSVSASISPDREESAYPSSSRAVAMNLLAGRCSASKLGTARSMTEPTSSGDFHDEVLLLPRARSVHDGLLEIPEMDGPPTSTPALSNAAPPDPPRTMARQRSYSAHPPHLALARPARVGSKHPSLPMDPPRALYQSSAVMRNRAPTPPRRSRVKDPMEDTQETPSELDPKPESEALGTSTRSVFGVRVGHDDDGVMNGDLEPTQVEADEGGEKDMTIDVTMGAGRERYQGEATDEEPDQSKDGDKTVSTPRASDGPPNKMSPTLLSSSDVDVDSLATRVTVETETYQLFAPAAPGVRFITPTTTGANIQDVTMEPLASSGVTTESSQDVDHLAGLSLGLSEIGAMSSQPAPTQFEMPATQTYDIERAGPLSFKQQESMGESARCLSSTSSNLLRAHFPADLARSLRSFEHDTTEAPHPPRAPPRGRKLERIAPPPTPALVRAHMSKGSSLETLDAQMDPTQIETCISSPAVHQAGAEAVPSSIALSTPWSSNSATEPRSERESTRPLGDAAESQDPEGHARVLVPPSEEPTQLSSAGPAPMEVDEEAFSEVGPSLPLNSRPPSIASGPVVKESVKEPQSVVVPKKKQNAVVKGKGKNRAEPPVSDGPSSESFDPIDSLPRARIRRPSARLRDSIGMSVQPAILRNPASTDPDVTLPPLPDLPATSSLSSLPQSLVTSHAAVAETRSLLPPGEANANAMSRTAKRRKTGTPTKVKKASAGRKAKTSLESKRKSAIPSTSRVTLDEGAPTVHFDERPSEPIDRDSSRATSVKASDTASRDVKPHLPKSKLPSTAPFNRVFGLWRDNSWLYPATAISVGGARVHVRFDDGSKGNLKFSEVRRLKLQRGDWVRYVGDEAGDTETQVTTLAEDVRVYRIESEVDGNDVQGHCEQDDIVAVTPARVPLADQPELARQGQIQRLLVCAIAIPPQHTAQFDDRRLTAVEIAGFEGKAPVSVKSPTLLSIPPPDKVEPLVVARQDGAGSLFARMAFIVTSTRPEQEKRAFLESMHGHGATVIDVQHLYTVETESNKGGGTKIKFQVDGLRDIDTILLLADQPRTSPKFLAALALGIPCVSSVFVTDSIEQSARCDWKQYAISTGHVQSLNASSIYTQYRAMSRPSFDAAALAQAHREGYGVFNARSFLFALPKAQIRSVLSIVIAAGATRFHVVASAEAASSAIGYDHIVLEDGSKVPSGLKNHSGVASMTWIKQCLIAGRLLAPAMMRPVQVIEVGH